MTHLTNCKILIKINIDTTNLFKKLSHYPDRLTNTNWKLILGQARKSDKMVYTYQENQEQGSWSSGAPQNT